MYWSKPNNLFIALSSGAAEFTDCVSVEGQDSSIDCPENDSKKSNGEVPVILELWEMRSTPLLPSLPGRQRPRVVAPDRVLSMSQIERNCVLMLNWIVWNRTVYIYKSEFGINNLQ